MTLIDSIDSVGSVRAQLPSCNSVKRKQCALERKFDLVNSSNECISGLRLVPIYPIRSSNLFTSCGTFTAVFYCLLDAAVILQDQGRLIRLMACGPYRSRSLTSVYLYEMIARLQSASDQSSYVQSAPFGGLSHQ